MVRLPSLDALRVFAVAARHLSFTKAGRELHLTQSAVSHRIKALEDELGIALFQRLMRRLESTGRASFWRAASTRRSTTLRAPSRSSIR